MATGLAENRANPIGLPANGRTNDPRAARKQIRLQYAGIGADYRRGWTNRSASGSAWRRWILRSKARRLAIFPIDVAEVKILRDPLAKLKDKPSRDR
jgi:hypothetical protein